MWNLCWTVQMFPSLSECDLFNGIPNTKLRTINTLVVQIPHQAWVKRWIWEWAFCSWRVLWLSWEKLASQNLQTTLLLVWCSITTWLSKFLLRVNEVLQSWHFQGFNFRWTSLMWRDRLARPDMSFPQSGHGTAEGEAGIWWTKTESKEEGVILGTEIWTIWYRGCSILGLRNEL